MDKLLLEEKVAAILNHNDYAGLQKWYENIIRTPCDYVVFTVRRSYLLALIMEKITGFNMEENSKAVFLTDSSAILFCDKFARQYREIGVFPRILLCDDTLIHGRNFNHFLENMEEILYSLLPDYKMDDIRYALVRSVQIYVYARLDMPALILSRYESNVRYKCKVDYSYIHKLSNDSATLISSLDMANASYIYSEHLPDEIFNNLNLKNFIKTSYQNIKQYTKIQYIGLNNEKKAVLTLRIIKNNGIAGYRVIPFIFMPNLGEEETDILTDNMAMYMENSGVNQKYIKLLYHLKNIKGKRAFNELVTLWLSQAVLQDFNIQNCIDTMPDEDDIRKLARNFNCGDIAGFNGLQSYEEMIRKIVLKQVFSINDITRIVNNSVSDGRKLLYVTGDNIGYVPEEKRKQIKEDMEDYFYNIASKEEERAYELSQKPYYPTDGRSERRVRGCGFLLNEFNNGHTEKQAAYSVAYFLQMADAGVLALSSYAYSKTNVVGFSQFAKPGEQSLLLMPLRIYEWLPLISKIQLYCKWHGRKFIQEISEYRNSRECDIKPGLIEKFIEFVDRLSAMGQEASEWTGHYINKKEFCVHEGETIRLARFHFIEKQIEHVKHYADYRGI